MVKYFAAFSLSLSLLASSVFAEDYLAPLPSILGGDEFLGNYDMRLQAVFKDAYDRTVNIRMLAVPSFSPEYAVGLLSKSDPRRGPPYRIFTLSPTAQIWTYETIDMIKRGDEKIITRDGKDGAEQEVARLQSLVPADVKDLKIKRCESDIADDLGRRIIEVWRKMLLRTRYIEKDTVGLDGETYYFGINSTSSGYMSGQVWSPDRDSTTGNLVALAETMRDVCNRKPGANMMMLEKVTAELEHRLQ